MSAAGRPTESAASDLATAIRDAGFVRLVAAADGDSVAAAGLLADALDTAGVPYQTSVTPLSEPATRATDADLTVGIGRQTGDLTIGVSTVGTETAYAAAGEFTSPDLALALAGATAADGHPGDELATKATEHGIERRPGVAVPTTELVDGLAHSTLVHAPFSGQLERAKAMLADLNLPSERGPDERRLVASQVALAVAGDSAGTARGASRVEGLLRPLSGGPFGTIGGYADVLGVIAREQPGLAIVLALGGLERDRALDIWRDHARRTHETLRDAQSGRYDGLFVLTCDGTPPFDTVAQLAWAYRSPEPVVLAVGEDTAAAYAPDGTTDVGSVLAETATAVGARGDGTPTRGHASFEGDRTEFVAAFREKL